MENEELRKAGEAVGKERQVLAEAVVAQNERMDQIEKKAVISKNAYDQIVQLSKRIQTSSESLRSDVDDLLSRVQDLEQYVDNSNGTVA